MKIITYIDGFNFYHSISNLLAAQNKPSKFKWVDFTKMAALFLAGNDTIEKIYYFSAYASWKPESMQRHRVFVSILQDLGIKVVLGSFKRKSVHCTNCNTTILKHEEKQTDVNIAVQIMKDAYERNCECMQIVSGDTDLIPPIAFAKEQGIKIHIVLPPNQRARKLITLADKKSKINFDRLQRIFLGETYTLKNKQIITCPYL